MGKKLRSTAAPADYRGTRAGSTSVLHRRARGHGHRVLLRWLCSDHQAVWDDGGGRRERSMFINKIIRASVIAPSPIMACNKLIQAFVWVTALCMDYHHQHPVIAATS